MPSHHETTELQFGHSVAPQAVGYKAKTKYRDGLLESAPLTLMSDPRVVRGNTQAMARKIAANKTLSQTEMMRGNAGNSGGTFSGFDVNEQLPRPSYNYEVRSHVGPDLDLSSYLTVKDEELSVRTKDVDSQTNEFQPRPPTPEYIPRKTGVDTSTQITQAEVVELFDFDREVEPILSVIVHKTLEQALFEVQAEEELLALDAAAQQFHADKAIELDWRRQREMENISEQRTQQELIRQREEEKKEELRLKTVIGAVQAMEQLIPGVFEAAVESLYKSQVWRRPEVATVEDLVLAKSTADMKAKLRAYTAAQTLIDEIVLDAQTLYEKAPLWYDPPLPKQCEFTIVLPPDSETAAAAEGEDSGTAAPVKKKMLGPVRIGDRCSVIDVLDMMREAAREKEATLELSLATLHSYFSTIVGQSISIDGAIMNFGDRIPDELIMLL